VLVTVDRGETRVAMLEAAGEPTAARKSRRRRRSGLPTGYRVAEVYFERRGGRSIVGNIYKGRVDNVLAGLEAAFVDIGLDKNGFLHVDEIVLPGVEQVRRGRGRESGPRITDLLRPGQEIVVQVIKDPLKTKGARLTMELTIAGRYMVYAPTGEGVGVSRRLDDAERQRLRQEAKQLDLGGGGAIIRTAAHGATRGDFERELQYLFKLNEVLQQRVKDSTAPALVFQEADLSVRVVRDIFSAHFERAILDDAKQHHRLVSFFARTAPELVDRVELWEEDVPLFDAYGVEPVIEGMLSRRVDLPSGGYLMIDYAEALTVIDVNTGSFTGKGKSARLEDTITKTNLEAAEEVVNQLRLRDIGGIIVIDFIDMARARNRDAVLKVLRKALDEDRTKTFVVEISPLGLVEMTRQNVTDGAREIMTKTCPTCGGEGVVKSEETIAIEVERRLRELVADASADAPEAYLVRLNPKVTAYFTADGARMLHAVEKETGRFFHFEGSEGLPLDHFAITAVGTRDEIQERAVPFRAGEEVHLDIVEPHMYSEDDAVAKIDGYLIEVADAIPYVGEKKLVRIEEAGRTTARAVLAGPEAAEASAATEERRKVRERSAKRAATVARTRRRKADEAAVAVGAAEESAEGSEDSAASASASGGRARSSRSDGSGRSGGARRSARAARSTAETDQAAEALEILADDDRPPAEAGTAPSAVAEADVDAAKPRRRRRARAAEDGPGGSGGAQDDAAGPPSDTGVDAGPGEAPSGAASASGRAPNGHRPDGDPDAAAETESDGDDAVQSKPRRRGRRGGRRRSRANAEADAPEVSEASE
jgi:ribonuclease G